ncbi:type II secretion system F family protein [Brachybacterium sp. MASK1Z-5]|uniref:Type II secretion system F family protein n=1 Tax=Brachybacterium halotolerans TaxID=2795215 RepID=A0ABS1BDY1_9MICO|nr:type II secretion system F family protein [Brachybacterium halotolerans]MBK0332215.1 type II secretion system F family protein [Brachybacterium halotolerans]
MSGAAPVLIGAGIGLVAGLGLALVVVGNPWLRRRDLAARIDPYLRRDRGSALLEHGASASGARTFVRTLLGPVAQRMLGLLERLTGGSEQLEKRLRMAGRTSGIEAFRVEQVLWGIAGLVVGLVLAFVAVGARGASPLLGLLIVLLGGVIGIVGRDHLLQRTVARRAARMAREFPTLADLLALAVAAGESPVAAMERVARSSRGALPEEFGRTVAEIRAGSSVSQALVQLGNRTPLEALARFGEGVSIAIERGTPLAEVLRAQAQDAREASKRDLMELAGRREILMMVPVVFFVLPLVIVFAIFPGLAVLDIAL